MRSIITMFSLNSLTGFNFITRNVWLSYRQPTVSRYTENGNIPGSIEVSMYLKTTLNTMERITFSVSFVDMSTNRTFLACVPRVNSYNRFSYSFSLIPDKLFKFIERPIIQFMSKIYSSGSALNSYAGQILNSKNIKRHSHNFFRDTVINLRNKPLLFSANLPEKFFSRFSAFALQFRSKKCVLCSHVLDGLAIEKMIVRSHGDIDNSSIDSKNLIANRFRRRFMNNHMQIKNILLFIISQGRCFKFPFEILFIIFRNRKRSGHSSLNRRKTNILFDKVDFMHTFIISNSREWFAPGKCFQFKSFKCFAGNISNSLKNRTRKFRMLFSNTVISGMVNRYFAASVIIKTISGNLIKNPITQNHSLSKRFFAFIRQFQFEFNRSFHNHILQWMNVNSLGFEARYASSPYSKYGVSATPAPPEDR